jgi:hypothetical protein
MKNLFVFILFIFPYCTIGQNSPFGRGYEKGFKEGYCYNSNSVYCNPPITPLPPLIRLNESDNSFQDGYNRGFQVGLDLKRIQSGSNNINGLSYQQIPNYKFNGYVPQTPVELYGNILIQAQRKYDARVEWIQNKLDECYQLNYNLISGFSTEKKVEMDKYIKDYMDENINGKTINWAEDGNFNQMVSAFKSFEKNIYDMYKYLISLANSKVIDITPQCNTNSNPLFIIKKNDKRYFSTSQNSKDIISGKGSVFYPYEDTATLIIFYSDYNNTYYKVEANKYLSQPNNTTISLEKITSCDVIVTYDKGFVLYDKGKEIENQLLAKTVYMTKQGSYSQFYVFTNLDKSIRYYLPKQIIDNPIEKSIHVITKE